MKKIFISTTLIFLAFTPFLFGNFSMHLNLEDLQKGANEDVLNDNLTIIEDAILLMEDKSSITNEISNEESEIENWEELEFVTILSQRPNTEESRILNWSNPFKDFATLELKSATKNGEVKLFDKSGKVVLEQKIKGQQFELERKDLDSGVYFFSITDDGQAINAGKIILN